jgi:hypothetical protein
MDTTETDYIRSVYSIADVLTAIGGMKQTLFIGGVVVSVLFSRKIFISSIMEKLY